MAPSLLTIPLEIRFAIIKHVIGNDKKTLHLPCCKGMVSLQTQGCMMDFGWGDSFGHERLTPRGVIDVLQLMKVNRQLSVEVGVEFYGRAVVHICSKRFGAQKLVCLFASEWIYTAYDGFSTDNGRLHMFLEKFQSVNLDLHFDAEVLCEASSIGRLYGLLQHRWPILDNLRFLVHALNSSRSIRKVNICCNIFVGSSRDLDGSTLQHVLASFESLRTEIDMRIHWHAMILDRDDDAWVETTHAAPAAEYDACIKRAHARVSSGSSLGLMDDWVHVRGWLLGMFPSIRSWNPPEFDGDLAADIAMELETIPSPAYDKLRNIVNALWNAHDQGDQNLFQRSKSDLMSWWMALCVDRMTFLQKGPQMPEAKSDPSGAADTT